MLWELKEADAEGNVTKESIGGALETSRFYDSVTGRLKGLITTDSTQTLQNLDFEYYPEGNLKKRIDNHRNFTETFEYDSRYRLDKTTLVTLSFPAGIVTDVEYDVLGNITSKSDVGTYEYGHHHCGEPPGPHAVTRITGIKNAQYCYDKKGNMVSGDGRTLEYNLFSKPTKITTGTNTTEFLYGPSRGRIQRIDRTGTTTVDTLYHGSLEKVEKNGDITRKYSLGFGQVIIENGVARFNYHIRDNLGSLTAVYAADTQTTEHFSYDPWGKRRAGLNWAEEVNLLTFINLDVEVPDTQRGFTGHEHLDSHRLIHMNGRVYDPVIGRFLSADPIIQAPSNLQSYNRYSYVMNNPLNYTDPSGYSWVGKKWKQIRRAAITVAAYFAGTAICGPACGTEAAKATAGLIAASSAYSYRKAKDHGASSSHALRSGVISGVTTAAMAGAQQWIGKTFHVDFEKFWNSSNLINFGFNVTAHAVVGCAANEAFGESCGAGAAAGFGGAIIKPVVFGSIGKYVPGEWKIVAAGVAGGLLSKAADPNADPYFGAFIAAMGMFHNGCGGEAECTGKNNKNSGAKRWLRRKAQADRGSSKMPSLDAGFYPLIVDSFSVTFTPTSIEIGDIWLIDISNQQVLHYSYAGGGPAVGYAALGSREFGALYLSDAGVIEGFSLSVESDGVIAFGGAGTLPIPIIPFNPQSTSFTGGPSVGGGAGIGGILTRAWFQKAYHFKEAPTHLPLGIQK